MEKQNTIKGLNLLVDEVTGSWLHYGYAMMHALARCISCWAKSVLGMFSITLLFQKNFSVCTKKLRMTTAFISNWCNSTS
jgi:hypothetical protein